MEQQVVMKELSHFIRTRFKVPDNDPDFNDDIHLFDYGYVDSFGAVELNAFVQSEFGVEVKPSDLVAYPLNTIREIGDFVNRRKGETRHADHNGSGNGNR